MANLGPVLKNCKQPCHAVLVLAIFKYETRMRVRAMNRRPRLEGVQKMFFSWKIGHKTSALVEAMLYILWKV